MKYPKTIDVLGRKWKLVFKKEIIFEGEKCSGLTWGRKRLIEISSELDEMDMLETFLHEVGHALAYELGLHDEDVPSWVEHMMVNAYAKWLVLNLKNIEL